MKYEVLQQWVDEAQIVIITIARYSDQGFEGGYFLSEIHTSAEVSCMPDFIHRLQEVTELRGKDSMSI